MERKIEFGKVLKRLRTEKNILQKDLAKRLNVTQTTISKYEVGETFPTLEVLTQLADIFEVSMDELVYNAAPAADAIIEDHQQFIDDILNDMSLEELITKYNILIDGRRATLDEAKKAINAIRFDRFDNTIR